MFSFPLKHMYIDMYNKDSFLGINIRFFDGDWGTFKLFLKHGGAGDVLTED